MANKRSILLWISLLIGLVSTNTLSVLTHRYDFNGDPNDRIGDADGIVVDLGGLASFSDGKLVMTANNGEGSNQDWSTAPSGIYVDLPNGIISDAATAQTNGAFSIEIWAIASENRNWAALFSAGIPDNEIEGSSAGGGEYLQLIPSNGINQTIRSTTKQDDNPTEGFVDYNAPLSTTTEQCLAVVYDSSGGLPGTVTLYVDGDFIGSANMAGLDITMLDDRNNWLGRSQWPDPLFDGSYNEFRIYNHALGAEEVSINYETGPDAMPAILVAPADGVNIESVSTTLEWQPAPVLPGTLIEYDIYLGKEGEALTKLDTVSAATTTYPTGILDTNSTYNWRIDQVTINDPCTVTGAVWSFDTLQTLATLTGPVDTRVKPDVNENAEFVVAIDSDTTVTGWQWKMVGDPNDIDLNAGMKYDVSTSQTETTLTVKNVTATDVGQYYCVVTNGAGDNSSSTASLGLNLTVAHYEFETDPVPDPNVPDSSGAGNDGFAYGVPALVAGLVGSGAYDFDGGDNVAIPTVVRDDFTILAWVKTTQTISGTGSGWWNGGGIVNGEMPGGVDDFGMQLLGSKACVAVQNVQIVSETDINNGEWHHVAFTRDSATGQIQVYVDGRMEAEATSITGTLTAPTGLQIGKQQTGDGYLIGLIDDVIINDYVMEPLEIADVVYTVTQEHVCTGDVEFDFDNDCQVDLKDFAIFAERWLDCKFYPECF